MEEISLRNSLNPANADDVVFGTNPRVVKCTCQHHGLVPGDYVMIENVVGSGTPENLGGIPIAEFNTLHRVQDVAIDTFTFLVSGTGATSDFTGGGTQIRMSTNMPYEVGNSSAVSDFDNFLPLLQ